MKHLHVSSILVAFLVLLSVVGPGTVAQGTPPAPAGTKVVMLGTGTPGPDPDRSGPSVAIVVNNASYIVDFGTGVVRRAFAAALKNRFFGLATRNLKIAFLTHLHSDHTLGYPDLILTPALEGRTAPLEVYGPKGLQAMTDNILKAYSADIDNRVSGLEHKDPSIYKVNVHEIEPGVIYKDKNVTVKAFLVQHAGWAQAFGYRFETADRTIVISGDTVPTQAIVDACNGCDILIHEVYSEAGFKKQPPDRQKYHAGAHTSTSQLADIANKAKPGLLVLYHEILFGSSNEDLMKEIQNKYKGKVVSANDLDVY
jgi:ribonuclease BN (tRNA processing enzyme)